MAGKIIEQSINELLSMEDYRSRGIVIQGGLTVNNVYQNINGDINGTANAAGGNVQSTNYTINNPDSLEVILSEIREKVKELGLKAEELDEVNDDIDSLKEQVAAKEPKVTRIRKSIENITKIVAIIPYKKEIGEFILKHLEQIKSVFNI